MKRPRLIEWWFIAFLVAAMHVWFWCVLSGVGLLNR
jgi:hypothetical protein